MKTRLWRKLGEIVVARPYLFATAVVLVSVLLGINAIHLRSEFSFRKFFPKSSSEVKFYEYVMDEFGRDDNAAVISVEASDLFSYERFKSIANAVDKLERLTVPEIEREGFGSFKGLPPQYRQARVLERVESPLSAIVLRGSQDELAIETVKNHLPDKTDKQGWQKLREYFTSSELYSNALVSADGKVAAIVAYFVPIFNKPRFRPPVAEAVRAVANQLQQEGFVVHVGGIPYVRHDYTMLIIHETYVITTLGFFFLLAVLWFVFRSGFGIVLPQVVTLLSLAATLGLMGAAGAPLTILTTVVPVIILIVGVSDSVHLLSRYMEELKLGKSKREAILIAVEHLGLACFITSFTTAVGFSVLAFTPIAILRQFGLVVAFGVLYAYVATLLFLPAALMILPQPNTRNLDWFFSGASARLIEAVIAGITRHPGLLFGITASVLLLSVAGSLVVEKNMRLFEDLDEDHPIIATNTYLEHHLGGVLPFDVVLKRLDGGDFKDPEMLLYLERVRQFLESQPGVLKVFAPSVPLKLLNRELHGGKPEFYRVPESRALAAQLALLLDAVGDSNPLERLVRDDWRLVRVSARVQDLKSKQIEPVFEKIRNFLRQQTPFGVQARLTGTAPVAHMVSAYLVDQIFYTFLLAFGVITVLLWWQFGSIRAAALSLVPNLLPLFALLAMMGFFGVDLKPTSAITFSIAFGIAVDDTIHYLTRFISEFRTCNDHKLAAARALRGTGRAMIFTTIILVGGFLVTAVSEVVATRNFGLLTSGTLVIALFGDLVLMPLVLVQFKPKL